MFRRIPTAWFLLTLALGCSTRLISDELNEGTGGRVVLRGKDAGQSNGCIEKISLVSQPRRVEVLILLDRSGSMGLTYGGGTRFQAASDALVSLVSDYAGTVQFGFASFPAENGCAVSVSDGCCVSPPIVPVVGGGTVEVAMALRSATPLGGNTPTALALEFARQHFAGFVDGVSERFVLLVTDGDPSCSLGGLFAANSAMDGGGLASACQDALESVGYLVAAGIKVPIVTVGLGPASGVVGDAACLDILSHAGNAAASPGTPGYFTLPTLGHSGAFGPGHRWRGDPFVLGETQAHSCGKKRPGGPLR